MPVRNLAVFAVAAVFTVALSACGRANSTAAPPQAPEVTVAEVLTRPMRDWDEFTGRLEAVDNVELHPRVSGYVERVDFKEGARVHKGDLLFEIDARPFRAEVARLQAQTQRASAALKLAEANRARAERLFSENAISREEADQMQTDAATSAADLAASQAGLQAAQLNLEFTEVRAPIDGRVSRALITAGNLVTPASLLTTVVSDTPVYAYFDADESTYLRYAQLGRGHAQQVYMGLVDETGYPHEGQLDFVDNQIDPHTGTIRGRAVFDNTSGKLTPGLFARIKLIGPETHDTVLIEERAIATDLGRKYALVLKQDNTVEYRAITLGRQIDDLRVVSSGLSSGESIVVNGLQRVRPGAAVTPQRATMNGDGPELKQIVAWTSRATQWAARGAEHQATAPALRQTAKRTTVATVATAGLPAHGTARP